MCSRQIFCYLTLKFYFHPKKNAILSFDVNAPQLTSCVTLCVNKSSRHFTRIKCSRSIIVSKLEWHILTNGRIHKILNIFKTRSKCYLDFNLHFKFIRVARAFVIKRNMYMFCMDCLQVHPFNMDMIIKSDTSAIKLLYIEYLNINDAYIFYVCTCIRQ